MATRTNPMAGRYFNDPNLATAFSSLAGAFAPPSPDDYLTAEQVFGKRFENQSIQDAWAAMTAPGVTPGDQDRYGIAATLFGKGFTPTQSNRAVDVASSDRRYATDVGAQNALDLAAVNNEAEMRRLVVDTIMSGAKSPLTFGQVTPGIDPALATALGVTAGVPVPSVMPQSGAALGAPQDPLTSDEVMALAMQGMIEQDPSLASRFAYADLPTTNTIDPATGRPVVSFSGDAAAAGAEPFINQGGQAGADLVNYRTPDGVEGTAIFDPNTKTLVDAATGAALPPNTVTFKIAGGDRAAASGATTSNITEANRTLAEVDYGRRRVAEFQALLEANPDILGIPGKVRGFAQDLAQAAIGLGSLISDDGTVQSLERLRQLADEVSQEKGYNPAFAQAAALALEMAYMDAKMQDPSGEVNVRELEHNLGIYDGGLAGNPRVLSTLKNLSSRLDDREIYGRTLLGGAAVPPAAPAAPPAVAAPPQRPRAVNPDTGETVEWDGQQWVPVQ